MFVWKYPSLVLIAMALGPSMTACVNMPTQTAAVQRSQVDMEGVVDSLQPLLTASKRGAILYYRAVCRAGNGADNGVETLSFPKLSIGPARNGASAVEMIRRMLPAAMVVEERSSVISIAMAPPFKPLLDAKVNTLVLSSAAQFSDTLAVSALLNDPDVRSAMNKNGYSLSTQDVSFLPAAPRAGSPHLPAELSGLGVNEILVEIARTFRGMVFVGMCEDRKLYSLTVRGGPDWTSRP